MSKLEKQSALHWLGVSTFVVLFALILFYSRSLASPPRSAAQSPSGAYASGDSDESFASKAAAGGIAEVKFGQLAQEKASDPAVKSFGRRMVEDHGKAGEQLKQAAQSENITLPSALRSSDQAHYNRLAKLSGPEFDRAYLEMMVKDHEEDVAEFKKEASSGKNQAIKEFAAQTLPTIEDHLKEARELAANRKASM